MSVDPTQYLSQLEAKTQSLQHRFQQFSPPSLQVFASEPLHFRMRAEFRIWHQGADLFYAFFPHPDKRQPELLTEFPIASLQINQLMPKLLEAIRPHPLLKDRLFQIDFLTGQSGEALISLLYHKKLGDEWHKAASELKQALGVSLIGRSRGQKLCLDRDFINERLQVGNRSLHYRQVENSFTQPNAGVAQKMLEWTCQIGEQLRGDLLELYCGNGNFSIALAPYFNRVLATEIAKSSVEAAQHNLAANQIDNVRIVRLSSEEMSQALAQVRPFRRLADIDLASYRFSTLLLDPPRAGLDPGTLALAQQFDNILYISCNPDSLHRDLQSLTSSHSLQAWALFDQFPYTHHIETGVWLKRKAAV